MAGDARPGSRSWAHRRLDIRAGGLSEAVAHPPDDTYSPARRAARGVGPACAAFSTSGPFCVRASRGGVTYRRRSRPSTAPSPPRIRRTSRSGRPRLPPSHRRAPGLDDGLPTSACPSPVSSTTALIRSRFRARAGRCPGPTTCAAGVTLRRTATSPSAALRERRRRCTLRLHVARAQGDARDVVSSRHESEGAISACWRAERPGDQRGRGGTAARAAAGAGSHGSTAFTSVGLAALLLRRRAGEAGRCSRPPCRPHCATSTRLRPRSRLQRRSASACAWAAAARGARAPSCAPTSSRAVTLPRLAALRSERDLRMAARARWTSPGCLAAASRLGTAGVDEWDASRRILSRRPAGATVLSLLAGWHVADRRGGRRLEDLLGVSRPARAPGRQRPTAVARAESQA